MKENAASLQAFIKTVLRDAEKLEVSEFQEPVKAAFTSSLKSYVAAETLQGMTSAIKGGYGSRRSVIDPSS